MKSASQRFLSYALILHPNAHATRGRPTLNDVERFRNGPVHELSSLKASQMCKVHTMKVKCDHRSKFSNLSNWREEA